MKGIINYNLNAILDYLFKFSPHLCRFFFRMKHVLLLSVFCVLVCVHVGESVLVVSVKDLSDLPSLGVITVKEGASVVIKCNVSELHEHIEWFDSKGHVLNGEDSGESFSILTFYSVQRSEIVLTAQEEKHLISSSQI